MHKLTLRIVNCHAIFLGMIAVIIRFAYFPPKEEVDSDGNVQTVNVKFPFVVTTIFVLPGMLTFFILLEFRIKREIFALYFNYLEFPIGKGIYLIMIGLMIAEVQGITEAIFCILLSVIGLFNVAIGITYESLDYDPYEEDLAQTIRRIPVNDSAQTSL